MGTILGGKPHFTGQNGKLLPPVLPLGTPCLVAVSTFIHKEKKNKKERGTDLPTVAQARLMGPVYQFGLEGRPDVVGVPPMAAPTASLRKNTRAATSPRDAEEGGSKRES